MKKIWDKIRKWLIKKLGGYTSQYVTEIVRPMIQPTMISAVENIDRRMEREYPNYLEDIKWGLIQKLAREMYDNGSVYFERCEQPFDIADEETMRATVFVIPHYKEKTHYKRS